MKPSPETILNQAFAKLAMEIGPALPPGYSQGSVTTTAVLLLMTGQEFNRAADIRVKENAAMRTLFAEQAKAVSGTLGEQLRAQSATTDTDLTVATLDKGNAALKTTLIALQTHAEDAKLQPLQKRIAAMLQEFATARQIFLPAL
ncbi:MAG: hypothetical protein GC190_06050 [Alphaproteobacteria bacterium]|nr:hypothetical protein [Alphaproteobacteria bacterium]